MTDDELRAVVSIWEAAELRGYLLSPVELGLRAQYVSRLVDRTPVRHDPTQNYPRAFSLDGEED